MTFYYLPDIGFEVGSKKMAWGEKREVVRRTLADPFQQDDGTLDNSEFFDGDTSHNITYRRDIYDNFKTNYDDDDCLSELEIHDKIGISVAGIMLTFGKDISDLLNRLRNVDNQVIELEPGQFLFKNLKMTIGNAASMGGDGNGFNYFYAGKDISHLID